MDLVKTCRYAHCVLACIWMSFVSTCWATFRVFSDFWWVWAPWKRLGQYELRYMFCPHSFARSLVNTLRWNWRGLGQHMLRCILCARCQGMGLVNTYWDAFCVLGNMGWFWSMQVEIFLGPCWHGEGNLSTQLWDAFCVHVSKGWMYSTLSEVHFASSLSLVSYGFRQHMVKFILCPRYFGMGFVNTNWDTFCVLPGIVWVWSTLVEMHFVCSMAKDGFILQRSKQIFCPRWHERCLVNTC